LKSSHYNFIALENLNYNVPESGPSALALKLGGKGVRFWRFI
jgi:hypothetical protein